MTLSQTLLKETNGDIITRLAGNLHISPDSLRLFSDYSSFLTELFQHFCVDKTHLYVVGHAQANLAIIADRADLPMTESLGTSPFSADIEKVTECSISSRDIIYLSNPNRVTGATMAGADIEMLANAVPDGLLLVDEQYFDFYGISAISLLDNYSNIVVLRSFAATYGIYSAESGFAASSATFFGRMDGGDSTPRLSATTRKLVTTILDDQVALSNRLAMVHGESLRIAGALNRLGIQNRISATDFILLRVEDPTAVGNALARYRVSIDNLEGYPGLKHYLRYRIASPSSNDEFIRAFSRMPVSTYRMKNLEKQLTTLRKGGEQKEGVTERGCGERLSSASIGKAREVSKA